MHFHLNDQCQINENINLQLACAYAYVSHINVKCLNIQVIQLGFNEWHRENIQINSNTVSNNYEHFRQCLW